MKQMKTMKTRYFFHNLTCKYLFATKYVQFSNCIQQRRQIFSFAANVAFYTFFLRNTNVHFSNTVMVIKHQSNIEQDCILI